MTGADIKAALTEALRTAIEVYEADPAPHLDHGDLADYQAEAVLRALPGPIVTQESLARALVAERVIWTSEEGGPYPDAHDRKQAKRLLAAIEKERR